MFLKIKRLVDTAIIPSYQTYGASGMDLHACLPAGHDSMAIMSGARLLVPTGLAVEVPEDVKLAMQGYAVDNLMLSFEAQIRPRSGLANKMGIVACFGTIDADYRGEIYVNLFNHSFVNYKVSSGERIAQLVVVPVIKCNVHEVQELSETERGVKGFGSSGNF